MRSNLPFETGGKVDRNIHQSMATMARLATEVCFEGSVIDLSVFPPIPHSTAEGDYEAGRIIPERNNVLYAFSSALYAKGYGPASEAGNFKVRSGDTVGKSLYRWDEALGIEYRKVISPKNFRRVLFEGGLFKVFIDPSIAELQPVRAALDQPDFGGLDKDPEMIDMAEASRKVHFIERQFPHYSSHIDAVRFVNQVLDIGFREFGLSSPADLEQLMRQNLPELKRLARISIPEMEVVSSKMIDPDNKSMYSRDFLDADPETKSVTFDEEKILSLINDHLPDAEQLKRRGCPVLFQKTKYQGNNVPVFNVMNETLVRIYKETGALKKHNLRKIV